jgi:hypothetical protein
MIDRSAGDRLLFGIRQLRHRPPKRSAYAFVLGTRSGITSTCPTLRAEHVIEAAGELRVVVAQHEAHLPGGNTAHGCRAGGKQPY